MQRCYKENKLQIHFLNKSSTFDTYYCNTADSQFIPISNIPLPDPEEERGTKDRAFYFREEWTPNFASSYGGIYSKVFKYITLKKKEKPSIPGKVFRFEKNQTFTDYEIADLNLLMQP